MSENDQQEAEQNLIPIETIEPAEAVGDGPFVTQTLADDPDSGDGSAGRDGVEISSWRLHKLGKDRLMSVSDPSGEDRRSRRTREFHAASRKARSEEGRASRKRVRLTVALLVALVVASVAWAAISYALEQWGGKTIPYVVGLSQTNATEQLEKKGLKVTLEEVPSDTIGGHVIGIDPAEGTRVEEGSKVHLVVGIARTIPEVVGMSREDARATLEAAGAQDIRFESHITVEEEDKVLEVRPAAGSVFMSSDEVIVVVSQLPRMIDVVGQEEDQALLHLDREGIAANVQYERGSAEQRLHVIRTEPEAGQPVGEGGVTVVVGDSLISATRVEDYFDSGATHASEFLQAEGYSPQLAYGVQDGSLKARFANADGVSVSFTPEPWSRNIVYDQSGFVASSLESSQIRGVRITISVPEPTTQPPQQTDENGAAQGQAAPADAASVSVMGINSPTVGETTAKDVMALCGLEGMLDSCTQSTITLPPGTASGGHVFYCCNGESAQNSWTVFIRGASANGKLQAKEIVVTCVPKSSYAAIDLTNHGNKVCNYVAYQEEYV